MQRRDQIVVAVLRLVVDRRAALQDVLQAAALKVSPSRAARQTSSASVSAARPSPSAIRTSTARASASSGSFSALDLLGAGEQFLDRRGVERLETPARGPATTARALSSNDGFSVVAPTSTTVPSSITGRNESCCARLKRCTSSTNSSVPAHLAPGARGVERLLQSATPENTAEAARNAARSRPPAAAPPWSCRCPAAPRRSATRACASPACG
jgi:hypothetical protein